MLYLLYLILFKVKKITESIITNLNFHFTLDFPINFSYPTFSIRAFLKYDYYNIIHY